MQNKEKSTTTLPEIINWRTSAPQVRKMPVKNFPLSMLAPCCGREKHNHRNNLQPAHQHVKR